MYPKKISLFLSLAAVLFALALTMVGCQSTTQERLAALGEVLGIAKSESAKIDGYIADLQAAITSLQGELNDPALPADQAAKIQEVLAQAQAGLITAQEVKQKVDVVVSQAQAKVAEIQAAAGDSADFSDELAAVSETLKAIGVEVPPPIGTYIGLVGVIVGIFGGLFGKKYKSALTNVVSSVEKGRDELSEAEDSKFIAVTKDAQFDATRALVNDITASLKKAS